jgi:NADH-quinone oxidoreductase subunit J
MLAEAVLFILLRAYFVAVIQVLIYAGAILVLFLFVVMLLGVGTRDLEKKTSKADRFIPFLIAFAFPLELGIVVTARAMPGPLRTEAFGTVEAIGGALFTSYLLPFELISGILLIGIFGVVGLAQRSPKR